jgi:ankyrin repeat protein
MFPNPQDSLPLPHRPDLDQYKKLAKDLVKACKSGDPAAIGMWTAKWVTNLVRLQGVVITPQLPVRIDRWVQQVEEFARRKLEGGTSGSAACGLADAQFVMARAHGFESWPRFARHVEALTRESSSVSKFESATDAIIHGNAQALIQWLREEPELIRAHSTREHQATLLHYVSANGIEGYRQKTPENAVKIAEILLQAGAEVDATANVYGGGATTLGLVATSIHPEQANVQIALLETLLNFGADIHHPGLAGNGHSAVTGCLANGCGQAAEFLAGRGTQMNLEEASGVGRLDVVKTFFNEDGSLKPAATREQMLQGFLWACGYGRNRVVEFFIDNGLDLGAQDRDGQTGLHWAAIFGQLETIRMLLERKAPLETRNVYGGTVLGQALWSAINSERGIDYVPILETLIAAGAKMEPGSLDWLEQQNGSSSKKERLAAVLRHHGAKSSRMGG